MLFSEFQKKKKKGKENGNLLFYQFIIPYYYDSLKNKKSLYTPCIAFTHLLYPIYLPTYFSHSYYKYLFAHIFTHFYYNNFASFHIYPPCIALPFIQLLCFNYIFLFILFNNSMLLLLQYVYFFLFSELGD